MYKLKYYLAANFSATASQLITFQKCGDVIGAAVLIVEVISMFPHINADDRGQTVRERAVLIGGGDNSEAAALLDEPSPTGAEAGCGRLW